MNTGLSCVAETHWKFQGARRGQPAQPTTTLTCSPLPPLGGSLAACGLHHPQGVSALFSLPSLSLLPAPWWAAKVLILSCRVISLSLLPNSFLPFPYYSPYREPLCLESYHCAVSPAREEPFPSQRSAIWLLETQPAGFPTLCCPGPMCTDKFSARLPHSGNRESLPAKAGWGSSSRPGCLLQVIAGSHPLVSFWDPTPTHALLPH